MLRSSMRLGLAPLTALSLAVALLSPCRGHSSPTEEHTVPVRVERHRFLPLEPVIQFATGSEAPLALWRGYALGEGWSRVSAEGIWATGYRSVLEVSLVAGGQCSLFLECLFSGGPADDDGLGMTVRVNGTPCGGARVAKGTAAYRFDVPEGLLHAGANEVELTYSGRDASLSADVASEPPRPVLCLRRLALLRDQARTFDSIDWSEPVRLEKEMETLRVRRGGTLVLAFSAAASARWLTFELRASGPGASAARYRVLLGRYRSGGEEMEVLDQRAVDRGKAATALQRMELDGRGGDHLLRIDLEDGGAATELAVTSPRLVLASAAPEDARRHRRPSAAKQLPDIVLIILDAARADHLGRAYGYERDTVPSIDSLAHESLVFTSVFAQASDTTCSTPTMLTGVSFAAHRVGFGGKKLSAAETTLAEYLHGAGYFTIGYYPSPKLSSVNGLDQGYDELHETWKTERHGLPDATAMAEIVASRIRTGFGPGPLFLLVHLLPPHMPYRPRPEFDVFGEPGYQGSSDGSTEYARSVNLGRVTPAAEDIREEIALYDGNLRMADHAVSLILGALAESGRGSNAVVVVTADHGEAFMEHGRLGHSATIYQEVLRVPLILRLPAGRVPAGARTDRLASLEDLVPTLLGIVGVEPVPRVTGIDLLADGDSRESVVLHSEDSLLGLLTRRWKLVVRPDGERELYDLVADPRETRNLAMQDPVHTSFLDLVLAHQLDAAPAALETEKRAAPTEQEREMLRALGYLK